jgi:hypothetical protein
MSQKPSKSRLTSNQRTGLIVLLIVGIPFAVWGLFSIGTTLSVFGTSPETISYTGYAKFTLLITNQSAGEERVNGTFQLIDYENGSIIADNITADGTAFVITSKCYAYLTYVNTTNGLSYPNACYVVNANSSLTNPKENIFRVHPLIEASQLSVNLLQINSQYGVFTMGDIPDANFTCMIAMSNSGNGTAGDRYVIPEIYRYNESISNTALWLKINVIVDAITMGLYDQPIFYDGLGNTYLQLPNLYMVSSKSISLQFTGSVKPTSFEFINGQWNSSVLKTIV